MEPLTFGKTVRAKRLKMKLSLREAAKRIDISYPYLFEIEKGSRRASEDVVKSIVKVLGLENLPNGEAKGNRPASNRGARIETAVNGGQVPGNLNQKKQNKEAVGASKRRTHRGKV